MWTVIRLINTTAELLEKHGSPSGRADSQYLVGHVLGLSKTELYMGAQRPVDDAEREALRELVKRRVSGEPIAYILGTVGFWTLDLKVDERVLIPRPETEHLVEQAIKFTKRFEHHAWRIVDVGTGSGAIALALASELPNATVLAIDISADALEVARENADLAGLRDRVKFVQGDALAPLSGRDSVVDIIVSNPPYVAQDDPDLESRVREFEPNQALFAGGQGMAIIKRLTQQASSALCPGGLFLCEHGHRQGAAAREAAERADLTDIETLQDFASLDRVLVARRSGSAPWPRVPEPEVAEESEEGGVEDEELTDGERMLAEAIEIGLPVVSLEE
ncbi:MAG: release factor glutamine methyltransferase [Bradymonadia bacterium]|jgi:release factor glutamine methyltransferase